MRQRLSTTCLAAGLLLIASQASARDLVFGVQASLADEADFGIGARVVADLSPRRKGLSLVGSFDLFFPDNADYWELNANLTHDFASRDFTPYAGAGLNLARFGGENGGSDSDLGLNLLGGLEFRNNVFVELRTELGGGDQDFVLTGGLTF